jgi:hypothetical protein
VAALHVANLDQDGDLSFDKMRGQFGNHVNLDRVIFAVGPGLRGPRIIKGRPIPVSCGCCAEQTTKANREEHPDE